MSASDTPTVCPGPCVGCGAENYAPSMGGPALCPACDCSPPEARLKQVAAQARELRAELDFIYSVVDYSDGALYDAVKKSKVRITGSA